MSIADEIFAEQKAKGLKRKPCKAWGKDLFVWELTAGERDAYEEGRVVHKGKKMSLDLKGSRAKLVVAALRLSAEEGAERVFADEDIRKLQRLGGFELDRVYAEAAAISGIVAGEDDEEEDSDAAKNSAAR